MRRFVRRRFSFVPGFFGNRLVGSLMDSKMEDVINQSSNYDLKFWSIFILNQTQEYCSGQNFDRLLFKQAHYIHDSGNPTSLFPAWVLQIDFSQCCGLFGNRLVASLHSNTIGLCKLIPSRAPSILTQF